MRKFKRKRTILWGGCKHNYSTFKRQGLRGLDSIRKEVEEKTREHNCVDATETCLDEETLVDSSQLDDWNGDSDDLASDDDCGEHRDRAQGEHGTNITMSTCGQHITITTTREGTVMKSVKKLIMTGEEALSHAKEHVPALKCASTGHNSSLFADYVKALQNEGQVVSDPLRVWASTHLARADDPLQCRFNASVSKMQEMMPNLLASYQKHFIQEVEAAFDDNCVREHPCIRVRRQPHTHTHTHTCHMPHASCCSDELRRRRLSKETQVRFAACQP